MINDLHFALKHWCFSYFQCSTRKQSVQRKRLLKNKNRYRSLCYVDLKKVIRVLPMTYPDFSIFSLNPSGTIQTAFSYSCSTTSIAVCLFTNVPGGMFCDVTLPYPSILTGRPLAFQKPLTSLRVQPVISGMLI